MSAPQVSWFERDNTADVGSWDIGVVDAGKESTHKGILIWNNRGGIADISDMQDCVITVKDESDANAGDLVLNKWIEVKVDSMSEMSFTPIGGETTKAIQASGQAAGVIKGTLNDAVKDNSTANFAEVTLRAVPPLNSSAGKRGFKIHVSYFYT